MAAMAGTARPINRKLAVWDKGKTLGHTERINHNRRKENENDNLQ